MLPFQSYQMDFLPSHLLWWNKLAGKVKVVFLNIYIYIIYIYTYEFIFFGTCPPPKSGIQIIHKKGHVGVATLLTRSQEERKITLFWGECTHTRKLTWKLKITCLKRKIIFQTCIFAFSMLVFGGASILQKVVLFFFEVQRPTQGFLSITPSSSPTLTIIHEFTGHRPKTKEVYNTSGNWF